MFVKIFACCVLAVSLASCASIQNSMATSLSGANKKGVPQKKKANANDPMLALTGESDVTLVSDFFPTALVMYEILHKQNPNHAGLSSMTGQLNIMYANAFVQTPAESLDIVELDKQLAEFDRAKLHYIRGRDYCLEALEGRHKGMCDALMSADETKIADAVSKLDANDVATSYWCASGWLGAFSLDPLDPDMLVTLAAPVALLEKAAALDPDYSNGAIWDVLCNFYVSAPEMFGGNYERGLYCHEEAMRASGGKSPGVYITYAQAVCVPTGDRDGFVNALNSALAINPDDEPSTRLMTIIFQDRAKKLLANVDDYFLNWE